MKLSVPFILASASPRRRTILALAGAEFDVLPSDVRETSVRGETPSEKVLRHATEKAQDVSRSAPDALVLGADTIVVLDDRILEKPLDEANAASMLASLSGRSHVVKTGVCLIHRTTDRRTRFVESTTVTFSDISEDAISEYVSTGAPLDKAGSYGIQDQGALFVERVEGDFYTVMGLPLNRLHRELMVTYPDMLVPVRQDAGHP